MFVLLASTSPRRRALLAAAGIGHRLVTPGPEPVASGTPVQRAMARARAKALGAVVGAADAAGVGAAAVVGVDTVVDLDGREFGKPRDARDAAGMIACLQGREHRVHTAVCVAPVRAGAREIIDVASSTVRFAPLDADTVRRHVASELWRGKAGGYGIQDPEVAAFATVTTGASDTVVGLPVALLRDLLAAAGASG